MLNMSIALNDLAGKWYIHFSNFPMWLKGDKLSPNFEYTITQKNDVIGLIDVVSYTQKGRVKTIRGFDRVLRADNSEFQWRGAGWMFFLTSQWSVIYMDKSKNWAIIAFKKTLFTPTGFDVIAKNQNLDAETKALIQEVLLAKGIGGLSAIEQYSM